MSGHHGPSFFGEGVTSQKQIVSCDLLLCLSDGHWRFVAQLVLRLFGEGVELKIYRSFRTYR